MILMKGNYSEIEDKAFEANYTVVQKDHNYNNRTKQSHTIMLRFTWFP